MNKITKRIKSVKNMIHQNCIYEIFDNNTSERDSFFSRTTIGEAKINSHCQLLASMLRVEENICSCALCCCM